MKRLSLIALLFISLISACDPDDGPYQCKDCVDNPEAIAANDGNGKGIYKGTMIGSTGTIKFDIANNGTAITGVLVIDGKSVALTTTSTYSNGFIGSLNGTLNGAAVIITFTVSNTGVLTIAVATIPGHPNPIFSIYKEKSNQIVKVFEGTYSGAVSGTFNMAMKLNENKSGVWIAINGGNTVLADSVLHGEVSTAGVIVGGGGKVTIAGSLDGDNVKGEWSSTDNKSGTWKGRRTL